VIGRFTCVRGILKTGKASEAKSGNDRHCVHNSEEDCHGLSPVRAEARVNESNRSSVRDYSGSQLSVRCEN
jgi:hypothetical protein